MKIHIVRSGDTMWELVQKYNIPMERLLEANPHIEDPEKLANGSKIRVPTGRVPVSPKKETSEQPPVEQLVRTEIQEQETSQLQPSSGEIILEPTYIYPLELELADLSELDDSVGIGDYDQIESYHWDTLDSLESSSVELMEYSPFTPYYPPDHSIYPPMFTQGYENYPYHLSMVPSSPCGCDGETSYQNYAQPYAQPYTQPYGHPNVPTFPEAYTNFYPGQQPPAFQLQAGEREKESSSREY